MKDLGYGRDPLNPAGLRRGGFSGARNLLVEDVPIRVPSQYNMPKAAESPFVFEGRRIFDILTLECWNVEVPKVSLPEGRISYTLPTITGFVDVMVFGGCENFDLKLPCEFCVVGPAKGKKPLEPSRLVEELQTIREAGLPVRSVSLNTGQTPKSGEEMRLVSACAEKVKEWDSAVTVSAEVWPYSIPPDIARMRGKIDIFQVNIELASDAARKKLCPGKPGKEAYFSAFEKLVSEGFKVTTVLQTNFYPNAEPLDGVIETVARIIRMGVVPEFLVSRAVKGANVLDGYFDRQTSMWENIDRFELFLGRMKKIVVGLVGELGKMKAEFGAGCVSCGMCNINKELKD